MKARIRGPRLTSGAPRRVGAVNQVLRGTLVSGGLNGAAWRAPRPEHGSLGAEVQSTVNPPDVPRAVAGPEGGPIEPRGNEDENKRRRGSVVFAPARH